MHPMISAFIKYYSRVEPNTYFQNLKELKPKQSWGGSRIISKSEERLYCEDYGSLLITRKK